MTEVTSPLHTNSAWTSAFTGRYWELLGVPGSSCSQSIMSCRLCYVELQPLNLVYVGFSGSYLTVNFFRIQCILPAYVRRHEIAKHVSIFRQAVRTSARERKTVFVIYYCKYKKNLAAKNKRKGCFTNKSFRKLKSLFVCPIITQEPLDRFPSNLFESFIFEFYRLEHWR